MERNYWQNEIRRIIENDKELELGNISVVKSFAGASVRHGVWIPRTHKKLGRHWKAEMGIPKTSQLANQPKSVSSESIHK